MALAGRWHVSQPLSLQREVACGCSSGGCPSLLVPRLAAAGSTVLRSLCPALLEDPALAEGRRPGSSLKGRERSEIKSPMVGVPLQTPSRAQTLL